MTLETMSLADAMRAIGVRARAAAQVLAHAGTETKIAALRAAAAALREATPELLAANSAEVSAARSDGLAEAMIERLTLDERRITAIAASLEDVATLPDPVGDEIARWTRPNGLDVRRVRVPLGVIGIIYESRPNVAADAGALCLWAGNAVILRCGSESFSSSCVIVEALQRGIASAGIPAAAVQLVPTRDREAVGLLLRMDEFVDVIIPRGGRSLIERVQRETRIPIIAHLDGVCHTYIDAAADLEKARAIIVNAKMRRVSICGATETLLVDRRVAAAYLPVLLGDLHAAGCEIRGDAEVQTVDPLAIAATEADWRAEYLDAILAVRVVDGVAGAIEHVNAYGSHHTDAIVTEDEDAANAFVREVESAIVLVNASTQFADGGELGMGAEIGISTARLPPRGPVGAEQLTTYKYVIRGTGQIRC